MKKKGTAESRAPGNSSPYWAIAGNEALGTDKIFDQYCLGTIPEEEKHV